MKKILIIVTLALATVSHADTFWRNGVLFGNVCRAGQFYTVYPYNMAQPVGTSCPVRNNNGFIVLYGTVSEE